MTRDNVDMHLSYRDTAIAEESEIADWNWMKIIGGVYQQRIRTGISVQHDNKNLAAFSKLYKDFPELTITLEYV